jgi:hypothetical protein
MSELLNSQPEELFTSVTCAPFANADETTLPRILHGYIRREELAKEIGRSPRTIDRWHVMREGPPRCQIGRTIFYNVESVREWLRSREQRPLFKKPRRSPRPRKNDEPLPSCTSP